MSVLCVSASQSIADCPLFPFAHRQKAAGSYFFLDDK